MTSLALVKTGTVRHYRKYTPDDRSLAEARKHSRELNTGLWGGSQKVTPPWDWRRMSEAERDLYR